MGMTAMRSTPRRTIARTEGLRTFALVGMCLVLGILAAPLRPGIVLGESMAPTFHSGQVFLMSQLRDPVSIDRGEVVLFDLAGQSYIKRVYAVAGDEVWGVAQPGDDGVFSWVVPVSDLLNTRDYLIAHPYAGKLMSLVVPPGQVFVLGDAWADSYDSRSYGPVPVAAVRGRVVVPRLLSLWAPDAPGDSLIATGEAAPLPDR